MRDDITMLRRLSLAEPIPRTIPDALFSIHFNSQSAVDISSAILNNVI